VAKSPRGSRTFDHEQRGEEGCYFLLIADKLRSFVGEEKGEECFVGEWQLDKEKKFPT